RIPAATTSGPPGMGARPARRMGRILTGRGHSGELSEPAQHLQPSAGRRAAGTAAPVAPWQRWRTAGRRCAARRGRRAEQEPRRESAAMPRQRTGSAGLARAAAILAALAIVLALVAPRLGGAAPWSPPTAVYFPRTGHQLAGE